MSEDSAIDIESPLSVRSSRELIMSQADQKSTARRMGRWPWLGMGFCLLCLGCVSLKDGSETKGNSELIFFGGPILTMESAHPTAEAVAVRGGRLIRVGRVSDVMETRGPRTRMIDLNGRTLLPGFHNAHVHPTMAAVAEGWIDLNSFNDPTPKAIWSALAKAVAETEPGQWLFAYGWDPMMVPGLEVPTLAQLDNVAPDTPVFITPQGGHQVFLNSRALAAAGITSETPDPGHGAYYERDADGALTGRLIEQPAFFPIQEKFGLPKTRMAWQEALQKVFLRYAEMGLTSVTAMGLMIPTQQVLDAYRDLTESTPLLRHNIFLTWYARDQLRRLRPNDGHPHFRIKGMKIWYDGSPYSATMLLEEPYSDNAFTRTALGIKAGHHGHANWTRVALLEAMRDAHESGWQIAVHTQGDRALREAFEILETVVSEKPADDRRHRFEHLMLADPGFFKKLTDAGMAASFHIQHIYYYGQLLRTEILGEERSQRLLPLRSAELAGTNISLHSDHPMFPS
ncbi:MAG: amidohydrolase, partial [Myxococcota bacterium]